MDTMVKVKFGDLYQTRFKELHYNKCNTGIKHFCFGHDDEIFCWSDGVAEYCIAYS
jgi:hypothetical protein